MEIKHKNPYEGDSWEDVEKQLFTQEEIERCKKKVKFYGIFIKLRKALGLTQRQLADISNVKQPMLARFETGENIPKVSTVCKILKPLGLSLAIVSDKTDEVLYKFENED